VEMPGTTSESTEKTLTARERFPEKK
jgi:hypothetical protein